VIGTGIGVVLLYAWIGVKRVALECVGGEGAYHCDGWLWCCFVVEGDLDLDRRVWIGGGVVGESLMACLWICSLESRI
jgi:hypothetical protein